MSKSRLDCRLAVDGRESAEPWLVEVHGVQLSCIEDVVGTSTISFTAAPRLSGGQRSRSYAEISRSGASIQL